MKSDYQILRGKCKEACEALQKVLPELRLVRGHYVGIHNEPHWWLETPSGEKIDPTVLQFGGGGEYEEFDGTVNCEECDKAVKEEDIIMMGNYPCCSEICGRRLVGLG